MTDFQLPCPACGRLARWIYADHGVRDIDCDCDGASDFEAVPLLPGRMEPGLSPDPRMYPVRRPA